MIQTFPNLLNLAIPKIYLEVRWKIGGGGAISVKVIERSEKRSPCLDVVSPPLG